MSISALSAPTSNQTSSPSTSSAQHSIARGKFASVLPTPAGDAQPATQAPASAALPLSNAVMTYLLTHQETDEPPPSRIYATPEGEFSTAPDGPDSMAGLFPDADIKIAQGTGVSLSAAQQNSLPPNTGGLPVDQINPSDAAKEIIDTIGTNGELNLSDIDKLFGFSAPESGQLTPQQVYAGQWKNLTGGSGPLTLSQLTDDIASRL